MSSTKRRATAGGSSMGLVGPWGEAFPLAPLSIRIFVKLMKLSLPASNDSSVQLGDVEFDPQEAGMKRAFGKFLANESGATAIEYGLIAAGISIAIIAAVNGLGTNLNGMFTSINNSLK